jgi:50S ribosome-binding GTPase
MCWLAERGQELTFQSSYGAKRSSGELSLRNQPISLSHAPACANITDREHETCSGISPSALNLLNNYRPNSLQCTIEPNEARCAVPDVRYVGLKLRFEILEAYGGDDNKLSERIGFVAHNKMFDGSRILKSKRSLKVHQIKLTSPQDFLCDLWKPPSMYPAYLQVTDIAGLIKGASQGEGLGNAFLSHIQAVDGMFHIVRAFDNDEVLHVDDSIDPVRDLSKSILSYCPV